MVWAGGGGFGEVFQSELSSGWQTRYDRNIMRLLKPVNGKLMSTLKLGDSEIAESPPDVASITFDSTKVAVKQLRTWVMTGAGGKTIDREKVNLVTKLRQIIY